MAPVPLFVWVVASLVVVPGVTDLGFGDEITPDNNFLSGVERAGEFVTLRSAEQRAEERLVEVDQAKTFEGSGRALSLANKELERVDNVGERNRLLQKRTMVLNDLVLVVPENAKDAIRSAIDSPNTVDTASRALTDLMDTPKHREVFVG